MKKFVLSFVLFSVFISCYTFPNNITKITKSEFDFLQDRSKNQSGVFGLQLDVSIPKKTQDYDDGILTNNFYQFTCFKGQGEIFFEVKDIERFTCYLNEYKIDTSKICKNGLVKFNISDFVKNGVNILYVSNIVPKEYKSQKPFPKLHIKIPYPKLLNSSKKIEGVSYDAFAFLDQLLEAEIENGFPSIQLIILKDGKIIKNSQYGNIYNADHSKISASKKIPVTNKTLYDLASNTKMYATTFSIQRLVYEKKLSLDDKVVDFFPEFTDSKNAKFTGKEDVTIRDLLRHTSGFRPGGAYYRKEKVKNAIAEFKPAKKITFDLIMNTPLSYTPRTETVYSDINFMLLAFIIEEVTKMPLDKYVSKYIYKPLGLSRICFMPMDKGFSKNEIAGTVIGEARIRKNESNRGFVHGRVHDQESFFAMDEVSGHAGLFANAESLAVLAQVMINGGGYGTAKLFDLNTVNLFTNQSNLKASHAIGWRRQSDLAYSWAFSGCASPGTIGHTGWTGTMTMIDRKNNLAVILCTNAKHSDYVRPMRYEGDYYLVKGYGAITSIIYSAFLNADNYFLNTMLIELAENKFDMLKTEPKFENNGYYKDLNAIMQTIKKRSLRSAMLRKFLRTEKAKQIKSFLKEKLVLK
ncbi:MAG: penicillin binding protein PBP4B [Treponema sp.]|nr:MAG: penicillin binding protein PBP4B [Treponema sp.]